MNKDISQIVTQGISDGLKNKAQDGVTKAVLGESAVSESKKTTPIPAKISYILKKNNKGKQTVLLFQQAFNEEQRAFLGIHLEEKEGNFFTSDTATLELSQASHLALSSQVTNRGLPQIMSDHVAQYLDEKQARRNEDSILARPYKTIIARLINDIIAEIYSRKLNKAKQIELLACLDAWINLIRSNKILFDMEKAKTASHMKFETFLIDAQRQINKAETSLRHETDAHQMFSWLTHWHAQLEEMIILSIRWFHTSLQTKAVPKNLPDELKKLGLAYQRHLEAGLQKKTEGRLPIKQKQLGYWQKEKLLTELQVHGHYKKTVTQDLLKTAVREGVISHKKFIFYEISTHYTADQLLWTLLYEPEHLDHLTQTIIKDELCYQAVLDLYRDTEKEGNGFLLLRAHMKQICPLSNRLMELNDAKQSDNLIVQLSRQAKLDAQAEWLDLLTPTWRPGIFQAVDTSKGFSKSAGQMMALIRETQGQQCQFAHLMLTLQLYLKLLPKTGEIIGGIALGPHLQSAVHLMIDSGSRLHSHYFELQHLFRFGNPLNPTAETGLETFILQRGPEWYEYSKKEEIQIWLDQSHVRKDQVQTIQHTLTKTIQTASEITQHCSPAKLVTQAETTEKLFKIADDLSEPFLIESEKPKVSNSRATMQGFTDLVKKSLPVGEIKMEEVKEEKENKELQEDKNISELPKIASTLHKTKNSSEQPAQVGRTPTPEPTNELKTTPDVVESLEQKKIKEITTSLTAVGDELVQLLQKTHKNNTELHQAFILILQKHQSAFFCSLTASLKGIQDPLALINRFLSPYTITELPNFQEPTRFKWWYRHTIAEQTLFFRQICFALLQQKIKTVADPVIIENFKKLVSEERINTHKQETEYSGWLDRWHRNIKTKLQTWHQHLCDHKFETHESNVKTNKNTVTTERNPELTKIMPTASLSSDFGIKSPEILQNEDTQLLQNPLDSKPEQFNRYKSLVVKSPKIAAQNTPSWFTQAVLCMLFIYSLSIRIKTNRFSFANDADRLQALAIFTLFSQVLQHSIMHASLCISVVTIKECLEKKDKVKVMHRFFMSEADSLIKTHSEIMTLIHSQFNMK